MRRIGLVLGAGGLAGQAYHSGVLAALEQRTGWDPRRADIVVGTSAGSVVAAMLRAGVGGTDLWADQSGSPLTTAGATLIARGGPPITLPTPRLTHMNAAAGMASAGLWVEAALRPFSVRSGVLAAASLPPGRVSTAPIQRAVRQLHPEPWPGQPTWICAVRLENGQRTTFGHSGAPKAQLGEAVAASCAIPGYFQPVRIGGDRYIDGGSYSVTNADLMAGQSLDLVIVSCPMAGAAGLLGGLIRRRLDRELRVLHHQGVPVLRFEPGPEERTAMGYSYMNPRRRRPIAMAARKGAGAIIGGSELKRLLR